MESILIIEDEKQQALAYKIRLSRNYEVTTVASADEAMEKLSKQTYGLILLDIMLPGSENGFDFLKKLKNNPKIKEIPVMVVTNLDEDCRKTAMSLGAIDYVIKSNSTLEQLADKINSFFAEK
jgi:CheY-like chemotaxis protein